MIFFRARLFRSRRVGVKLAIARASDLVPRRPPDQGDRGEAAQHPQWGAAGKPR